MSEPVIAAIAAMSRNRVMGMDNKLPWYIPGDLKFFKNQTIGKPVIMGRKTYESLGKPLPGRANIVVSRSAHHLKESPTALYNEMEQGGGRTPDGYETSLTLAATLEEAIEKARAIALRNREDEIIIGGGAQIYAAALPYTQRIYLTVIDRDYEGDTWFPPLPDGQFRCVEDRRQDGDPPYSFKIFERVA